MQIVWNKSSKAWSFHLYAVNQPLSTSYSQTRMSATLKFYFRKYFFLSSLYFKSFVFFLLLALSLLLSTFLSLCVVFTCEFEYKINICFHIIANVSGFATCPPGIIEFICKAFYKKNLSRLRFLYSFCVYAVKKALTCIQIWNIMFV